MFNALVFRVFTGKQICINNFTSPVCLYFLLVMLLLLMPGTHALAYSANELRDEEQRLTDKINLMRQQVKVWTRRYADIKKGLDDQNKMIVSADYSAPWIPNVHFVDRKDMERYIEDALLLAMAERFAKAEWDYMPDMRTFLRREKNELTRFYEREHVRMWGDVTESLGKLKPRITHIKEAIRSLEKKRERIRRQLARLAGSKSDRIKPPGREKRDQFEGSLQIPGWPWKVPEGDGYTYVVTCREFSVVTNVPKTPEIPLTFGLEQFRAKLNQTRDFCAPNVRYKTYATLRIEVIRKSTGNKKTYEGARGKPDKFK